jgi:hypothetical protein
MDAYLRGLEQAAAADRDLAAIRSVASFFISRVDSEVDTRLDQMATSQPPGSKGRRLSPTPAWPTRPTALKAAGPIAAAADRARDAVTGRGD